MYGSAVTKHPPKVINYYIYDFIPHPTSEDHFPTHGVSSMRQGVLTGQWYAIQFLMIEKPLNTRFCTWILRLIPKFDHIERVTEPNFPRWNEFLAHFGNCFVFLSSQKWTFPWSTTINTNHLFDTPVTPKSFGSSSYSRDPKSPCFTKPKTTVKQGPLNNHSQMYTISMKSELKGGPGFFTLLFLGCPTWYESYIQISISVCLYKYSTCTYLQVHHHYIFANIPSRGDDVHVWITRPSSLIRLLGNPWYRWPLAIRERPGVQKGCGAGARLYRGWR